MNKMNKFFLAIVFNLFHTFLLTSSSKFERNITKRVNSDLVSAIHIILDKKFFPSIPMINLVTPILNKKNLYFQDLQTSLLKTDKSFFNGTYIFRIDDFTQITRITHRLKVNNLIFLDSFESFLTLDKNLTPNKFNFRGFYLLLINEELIKKVQIIADALFEKFIFNSYAIFEAKGSVKILEFQLLRSNQCKVMNATQIDSFKDGKFVNGTKFFSLGNNQIFNCKY